MPGYYRTKIKQLPDGRYFIEVPKPLVDSLGWESGNKIRVEGTEVCHLDNGEHPGLVISNLTVNPEVDND